MSLNFWLSLQIHFNSTIVQYGPLNSFDSSMWKGLSKTESKEEFLWHCGLHISHWPCGENSSTDNGEEMGEEGQSLLDKGGSASLQYMADMLLIISSESQFGVIREWSQMLVPRCSARLIAFEGASWARWRRWINYWRFKLLFSINKLRRCELNKLPPAWTKVRNGMSLQL